MLRTLKRISLGLLLSCAPALAALSAGPFPTSPATTGTPYSYNFSPSGGTGPYSYTLISGTLPQGLSLGATTLSGLPAVPGSYPLTFTVTDTANGGQASISGTLVVNAGLIAAYTDFASWQSASLYGAVTSNVPLPGSPGGGTQYSGNNVAVPPAFFVGAHALFDCGGAYPTCGASAGTGWLKADVQDTLGMALPSNQNVVSASAHFAAAGGDNPTALNVIGTTYSGHNIVVTVDPGAGTAFVGFVVSDPGDRINSIDAIPLSASNSPAVTDFSYYALQVTSVSLTSSAASPSLFGQPITLTATVSPSSASGVVTFYNGATILGSRPLSSGQAQLTTSLLPAGSDQLRVYYSGNASNGSSTSNLLAHTIYTKLQNSFQTPVPYGAGSFPAASLATGDFNGDNIPDFAVANSSANAGVVDVLLGNSNGTFGAPTPYTVGLGARAVAIGDFNADGKSDLAVASLLDSSVSILLGNGDGTFQTAVPYSTSPASGPAALVIADFDGDGRADVATVNQGSNNISIFPGTGTGTLGTPTVLTPSAIPIALAVGDFNGDGRADLAISDQNSNLEIFLSTGVASFTPPGSYSIGSGATSAVRIAVADLNADGYPDLVTANSSSNNISVLLGSAAGTFGAAGVFALGGGSSPSGLAIGDFTGDGKLDVAVSTQGALQIMTGDGQGGFVPGATTSISGVPTDLAAADFNGDGVSDAVVGDSSSSNVNVLLGVPTIWGGQPVTISWQWPDLGQYYGGPQTATVGSGVEFQSFFPNNAAYNVDFSDQSVQIISAQTRGSTFDGGNSFNGLVIEPGAGSSIPPFTTVSLTSSNWLDANANPFDRWRVNFDSTHIYVDNRLSLNEAGDSITLKLNQPLISSTTTLSSSGSPTLQGQPVSFTATVPAGATGVVSFFKNSVDLYNFLGDATISGTTAVFTTSALTGSNTIVAYYNGDSTFDVSTSNTIPQVVQQTSTTTIQSSKNPAPLGYLITFQLHSVPSGSGTLTVSDGATVIGTTSPNSDGFAAVQTSSLTPGVHTITATYSGDPLHTGSSDSLQQTILPGTTTSLSTAGGLLGKSIALTATVVPSAADGRVIFYDGANLLGSVVLSGGTAVLHTSLLPSGVRFLHALYEGSASYSPSTSAQITTTITMNPQSGFVAPVKYHSGTETLSSVVGDFNGDGIQDVAVLDFLLLAQSPPYGNVTILLGNGDGTLNEAGAHSYPLGNDVRQILAGDFNHDGITDLLVADGASGVIVLTGAGDGTFSVGAENALFGAVAFYSTAIGDFNGDGIPDLLGGDETQLVLFLGDGAGGFSYDSQIISTSTQSITVADVNHDGNADVLWISNGGVQVVLGHGNTTFDSPQTYSSPGGIYALAVADFTGDNWPDIAIASGETNVFVLPNAGNGTFLAPITLSPGGSPQYVAAGDFNADGKQDVIAADGFGGNFYLIPSLGGGSFDTPVTFPTSLTPSGISIGSFAADGRLSLAIPNGTTDDLDILLAQLPPITVTCPFTAPVVQNVAYSTTCSATGGVAPYNWSQTGALPTGLSLNPATGAITGTPTATGPFSFTIIATDSDAPVRSGNSSLSVTSYPPLVPAASPLTSGLVGTSYSTPVFSGGTPPYTCGLSAGSYPPGLTMDGVTCVLSGIPTTPGLYSFSVGNSDSGTPQQNNTTAFQLAIRQTTTTTLSADANPATAGQNLTLTATVSPAGATGTVSFKDGSTVIGTGALNGSGIATFTTNSLAAGSHSLTAVYGGDTTNTPSGSSVLTEAVKNTTTVTLTSSANPAPAGQNLTFTATVSPSSATGTVTFNDAAGSIGTGTLSGGTATLTISSLAIGAHSITAAYPGDANDFSSSSSTLNQQIKTATTTSLTVSPATSAGLGALVTLTATVSPASNGQVTFYNNEVTELGTSTISNGIATLTTRLLPAGPNKLTAFYPGDSVTLPSKTSGVSEAILSAPQGGFDTGVTYSTGNGPWGNAVGDFNNDGHPDVITANYNDGTLSVLLGTAVGTFNPASSITVGSAPFAVAVADFNGDGNADIAVTNLFDNSISVLLGNGNATFAQPVTYTQGINVHPSVLVAADFDGDGFADLATINYESASVSVLRGAGDGTFAAGQVYTVGGHPAGLVAGDFNNDGKVDLASSNQDSNDVSILINKGDGTFANAVSYPAGGTGQQYLTAYDLNGDGALDLISANSATNNISVLNGTGTGAFGAPSLHATGNSPYWISQGDFNGDGKVDLAVSDDGDSKVTVFLSDGAGGLTSAGPYSTGATGGARGIAVADMNQDGISDLVVSSFNTNQVSIMLGLIQTTTALTSSVNPSTYGQTTTLNVTVSPSSAAGSVTFFDGATSLGSTGLAGGATSLDISSLTAGVHSLTAHYNGDIFNASSTSAAVSQTVQQVVTTTTLTASPNPSQTGQSVTLTATVAPVSGATIPTGTVTFFDGATALQAVALNSSAQATFTSSAFIAGSHTLTAVYSGDANDTGSTSTAVSQTVRNPTTTSLTSSPNPSGFGATVTFTATVSPSSAGGTVLFKEGGTTLGSGTLVGGVAQLTTSSLAVATHPIIAQYTGDSLDLGSSSAAVNQTVNPASSTTTLTSSLSPSTYGATVTLTATISPSAATGSVTFFDGATALGTTAVTSGAAHLDVSSLSVGSHSLTAVYGGDTDDAASTSPVFSQTVNQATTTTTLTSSPNPSTLGGTIALTATVSPTATGSVTFKDGTTVLGTGTLTNSVATLNVSTLAVGGHSLTAAYGGDANNAASTSSPVSQTVDPAATSVFLTVTPNVSISGESVSLTANVSPSSATGTITFRDGSTVLGTGTLVSGQASFSTSSLAVGDHTLAADYGGDANNASSSSNQVSHTVSAITAISLSTSNNGFALYGQAVPITATLDPVTATGKVTFYNGLTVLGTSTIAQGTATLTTTLLHPGNNDLTAYYSGDASNAVSRSPSYTQYMITVPGAGFQPAQSFTSGSQPSSQAAGDFNNDGITDLVATNFADNNVAVLLGNGDGTFQNPQTHATGVGPSAVAVGDFNLDGILDLAVANTKDGTVSIFAGTGDGAFTGGAVLTAQTAPVAVAVADFNRDGIPDLAVVNSGDDDVSIFMGVGDGTFTSQSAPGVGSNPRAIAVGDFNADGIPDLAVTSGSGGQLPILIGNGDGTFSFVGPFGTGENTTSIAAADFNNDGAEDLVVVNQKDNTIGILPGNGDGTFQQQTTIPVGSSPASVALGDFNGDGAPDLVVTQAAGPFFVLSGNGDGTFQNPVSHTAGTQSLSPIAADFNFDGRADIALANQGSGDVSVLLAIATTDTILSSSQNPSVLGQNITLTATVSPSNATGTVTFLDGTNAIGTAPLQQGSAVLNTASLAAGPHSITAAYGGDTANAPSASSPLVQVVNQSASSTTLSSSANPSTFGATIALTAVVSPSTATGSVTFRDGATTLGTIVLSSGTAVLNISTLTGGSHSLTAVYGGDSNNVGSVSSPLIQNVNPASTSTVLTTSQTPSAFGTLVNFTATVSPSTATGSVIFKDGTTTLGTIQLSSGTAVLSISTLSIGSHSLTAAYGGDTNDAASTSSPLSQTVKAATTVSLTSSTNTPSPGQPFTLTATVSPTTATGSITFKDGATTLGTASLSNGVATFNVSSVSSGSHTFIALYGGDANDAPGQGSLTLNAAASAPEIMTSGLPDGQAGVSYGPVTVQATGGSGTYSWSATGLPFGLGMSSGGTISGTPANAFADAVSVTVTDPLTSQSSSKTFNLTITPAQLTVNGPTSLGATTVGGTLTGSFSAQGGTPPYTWSVSGAAGFSIDQNGKVTGTPSQPGDSSVTVQVKDSSPKPLTALIGATFSAFGLTTGSLPAASTLTDYNASLSAAGGTPPYTFTATGLPPNLGVSGSSITGRPLSPGTFLIGLAATDSKGLSASTSLTLTVTGPGPLKILSESLANGTASQPYSGTLSAQGGSPAYTWALSGGVLPPGLSLDSGGNVFGTPTTTGSFSFGVQVTDTAGGKVVGAISLLIAPAPLQITNGASLPSGIADSQYPTQVLTATGGIAPYTFAPKGSLPGGLSLSSDGQISGTPTTAGDYTLGVVVTDSASPANSNTVSLSISVRPSSADLVLSAGSLSFSLTAGTSAVPAATTVTVTSSQAAQLLSFSTAVSGGSWLSVSSGGSTPSAISVGLAASTLNLTAAGSPYSGSVVVSCTSGPCAGKSQSIDVTLTVTSPPPQLSVTSTIFSFVGSTANPQPSSAALGIQNSGGGKLSVNSVSAADSWLSVTSFSGDVLPGPGAALTVTASPGSLPAGYYTSSISVKTSAGNASVPVTLLISSQATMVLGPSGAQFSMPEGGTPGNPAGSFLVSVSSTTGVSYSASVLPGASWLVGSGSGTATSTSPGVVSFSVDPTAAAALPVGAYYGTIRVSGSGIVNTPQDFQVVLSVSPAATPVVPDPEPGGLLFLSARPGAQPPQLISVYASSKTPLTFQASATTSSGGGWLSVSSTGGSTSAGSPAQLNALVDSTGLTPGVYSGAINLASGPAIRSVTVTLVVEAPVGSAPALVSAASGLKPADGPTCANAKLVPAPTGLATNFSAPAAWPTPISIQLVDTCGSVVGRGQIVATFSNGDPPLALSLVNGSTGLYSGTWTPRRTASQTVINAQASASGYSPAVVQLAGQVTPNAAPQLVPNGTLDVFHPQVGAGLGPGNIVQIYGTSLASQPTSANTLPLPTKVAGTQVLIGGIQAPLFYVSPTQVNAQIPFELTAGQQYQVIVNANGALTTPQPIQLTAAVPALLQFTSGLVIAQHGDGTLVSDTAPAVPGEFIVLYMTGLGATDIPVPTGQPSPANPPARVLDTPVLTLDEITVPTSFAGLTPGLVGLYQINLQIPADLPAKTYDLKVTQSGTVSNSTALPVKAPAAQ